VFSSEKPPRLFPDLFVPASCLFLRLLLTLLCVSVYMRKQVKEPRVLYGGGWAEMRMARAIEEAAKKTPGELCYALASGQAAVGCGTAAQIGG
jgi:hypothetical protein